MIRACEEGGNPNTVMHADSWLDWLPWYIGSELSGVEPVAELKGF